MDEKLGVYIESIDNGLSLEEKINKLKNLSKKSNNFLQVSEKDLVGFRDNEYYLIYEAIYGKDIYEKIVFDKRCGEIFNKSLNSLFRYRILGQTKKEFTQILADGLRNGFNDFLVLYKNELWLKKGKNLDYIASSVTISDLALLIRNIIFLPSIYPFSDREITSLTRSIAMSLEIDIFLESEKNIEEKTDVLEETISVDGSIELYFSMNDFSKDYFFNKPTQIIYDKYVEYSNDLGVEVSKINSFNAYIRDRFGLKISRVRKNTLLKRLGIKKFNNDLDNQDRIYIWEE